MKPLVSIMIPNYNHSLYLERCIKSAINQTYDNLEIVVLDNSSNDNSIEIATKFLADTRVRICKNEYNCFNRSYMILSECLTCGKYLILLCADDVLYPDFILNAVEIMEKYPNVGYVHGEKDIIFDNGNYGGWNPFYKCSFVAPGRNAMPIYMVATVANASQGVMRRQAFASIGGYDQEIEHMQVDRTLWFYLSYNWDVAYIKEKSCAIHIGSQTETSITIKNSQHLIQSHLTLLNFIKFAKEHDLPEVYGRKDEAERRLADEFVGYAARMFIQEDYEKTNSYLNYAKVINRRIVDSENYKLVYSALNGETINKGIIRNLYLIDEHKKRGYEPPKDYMLLQKECDYDA